MNLDNNAHSVFLLHYHLVLVVKYRRQVFDDGISSRAKEIFEYIAPNYNITLEEWNHDKDHIHILFRAHPNTEISKFINAYKSASSRLLKKEFPQIRQKLGIRGKKLYCTYSLIYPFPARRLRPLRWEMDCVCYLLDIAF